MNGLEKCRICCCPIDYNEEAYNLLQLPEVAEMFTACTDLLVDPREDLPSALCCGCYEELEKFHAFRTLCIEADTKWRAFKEETDADADVDVGVDIPDVNETLREFDLLMARKSTAPPIEPIALAPDLPIELIQLCPVPQMESTQLRPWSPLTTIHASRVPLLASIHQIPEPPLPPLHSSPVLIESIQIIPAQPTESILWKNPMPAIESTQPELLQRTGAKQSHESSWPNKKQNETNPNPQQFNEKTQASINLWIQPSPDPPLSTIHQNPVLIESIQIIAAPPSESIVWKNPVPAIESTQLELLEFMDAKRSNQTSRQNKELNETNPNPQTVHTKLRSSNERPARSAQTKTEEESKESNRKTPKDPEKAPRSAKNKTVEEVKKPNQRKTSKDHEKAPSDLDVLQRSSEEKRHRSAKNKTVEEVKSKVSSLEKSISEQELLNRSKGEKSPQSETKKSAEENKESNEKLPKDPENANSDQDRLDISKSVKPRPNVYQNGPYSLKRIILNKYLNGINPRVEEVPPEQQKIGSTDARKSSESSSQIPKEKKSHTGDVIEESSKSHAAEVIGDSANQDFVSRFFTCDICCKKFASERRCQIHKQQHGGHLLFPCKQPGCAESFNRREQRTEHMKIHTVNWFICEQEGCSKKYRHKATLVTHQRKAHDIRGSASKSHVCEFCGKVFHTLATLNHHRYTHKDKIQMPFACEEPGCSLRFRKRHHLLDHTMRHKGIMNYECPHCGVKKMTLHELKVHINHHTLERTWSCPHCSKVCNSSTNLGAHIRAIHEAVRKYQCGYCSMSFVRSHTRRYHEMIHTGERNYKCMECGKGFTQPATLRSHRKIHERSKPRPPTPVVSIVPVPVVSVVPMSITVVGSELLQN
ncbi:zinc finger protein 37-like isoform X1 [Drosophila guanche]|uniref:zinc finger protein 37-like isoform X1 n=1 Tax=Drosophila guanche TaxID=7266 RepID=UPI00147114F1|nr:zinc finger protein 37-like isoform X1 [Drosophila guanche]